MTLRSEAGISAPPAPPGVRLLVAAAAVVATLFLTLLVRQDIPYSQLAFFFVAVVLSAFLGGWETGLFAVFLSATVAELFIFLPDEGYRLTLAMLTRTLVFTTVSTSFVILVHAMQRSRLLAEKRLHASGELARELSEKAAQLEVQVVQSAELTRQLESVNAQLTERSQMARRGADRADRLQRFTAQLLASVGTLAAARTIVEDGSRAVEAATAAVVQKREDGGLEVIAVRGDPPGLQNGADGGAGERTPLFDVLEDRTAIWLDSDRDLPQRYRDGAQQARRGRAWAALPLEVHERCVGAVVFGFAEPGPFRPDDRAFMLMLAQQGAQALERARLHDMELRARVRAEFAERRLSFLAEASARLAASLDYVATLANLAHVAVPEIADWCLVHLLDDDGVPRLIAAAHTDPDLAAQRREMEERYPASLTDDTPVARVLRTGEYENVMLVQDRHLRAESRDHVHLELLRSLRIRSQLSVPIRVDQTVCGVVTLASAESGRQFGESDVTLALELGRRAAQAVSNARLYEAAYHASEAKSDFLAVMSHELRTPLNAIIGYTDLLLMGVPDDVPERARRQIERIRSASQSLLHLVEEVLSFSRVEAGKEEIRISPVDLHAAARECVTMVEPLAAEKGLTLRLNQPAAPVKVVSDERKIRQIVTNLLSNAVKFTERGGIDVITSSDGAEVCVSVRDTGIGIPPEHLERIFDPFWQVEQSATRRFGGTGLGLGVARKLARLLEGRLEVQSTVGQGSTFTLVLPLHTPGMPKPA